MAQHGAFYTDNLSTPLRVAQVVGLTSTAFFSGKAFITSFAAVPALMKSPAPLLAQQWKVLFEADKILAPAIAVFSSTVFGYISYRDHTWTKPSILYASSSALLALTIPYTFLIGEPVNQKLEEKERNLAKASITDASAEAGIAKEETVHSLVDKWATVNFGRFLITTVSAVLATWAAVDRPEVVPGFARLATGADRMG